MSDTPSDALQQRKMFPEVVPTIVERIYNARDAFYGTKTKRLFTQQACVAWFAEHEPELPGSLSLVERASRHYPELIRPWPIPKDRPRPWVPVVTTASHILALKQEDNAVLAEFDEAISPLQLELIELDVRVDGVPATIRVFEQNGVLHFVDRIRHAPPVVAAAISGLAVLDVMSDGRADGVIRWCSLAMKLGKQWLN